MKRKYLDLHLSIVVGAMPLGLPQLGQMHERGIEGTELARRRGEGDDEVAE